MGEEEKVKVGYRAGTRMSQVLGIFNPIELLNGFAVGFAVKSN